MRQKPDKNKLLMILIPAVVALIIFVSVVVLFPFHVLAYIAGAATYPVLRKYGFPMLKAKIKTLKQKGETATDVA